MGGPELSGDREIPKASLINKYVDMLFAGAASARAEIQAEIEAPIKEVTMYQEIPTLEDQLYRLVYANLVIKKAITEIEEKYSTILQERGIALSSPRFYLAIAIKESMADHTAAARYAKDKYARGYFQITEEGVIEDVNDWFNTGIQAADIYYDGDDPVKKEEATTANATIGILYWHICRERYVSTATNGQELTDEDKDYAATFIYTSGVGNFKRLWRAIKPKDYADFEKKLGEAIAKSTKGITAETETITSTAYSVVYESPFTISKGKDDKPTALNGKKIKIGKATYDVSALVDWIHYVRIVEGIEQLKYAS